MRSLLIAPADEQWLAEALGSGADAVVVDLASAALATRAGARAVAARFLINARRQGGVLSLLVRTHALDSGETDADLDAVMAGAPDAILLPGSLGAPSVQQLSAKLAVREALLGLADGATRIIAVADRAQSLFNMGSYRGSSARLLGVAFEMALVALQHADRIVSPTRDAVAQKIIELAKAGERDPGRLCDAALEACLQAIVTDPSPLPPHASPPARPGFLS